MNENHIKAIFEDKEFAKNLFTLETTEEAQAALKAKGIDMSKDEIQALRDVLPEMSEKAAANGEIDLEQLEYVVGGTTAPYVLPKDSVAEFLLQISKPSPPKTMPSPITEEERQHIHDIIQRAINGSPSVNRY